MKSHHMNQLALGLATLAVVVAYGPAATVHAETTTTFSTGKSDTAVKTTNFTEGTVANKATENEVPVFSEDGKVVTINGKQYDTATFVANAKAEKAKVEADQSKAKLASEKDVKADAMVACYDGLTKEYLATVRVPATLYTSSPYNVITDISNLDDNTELEVVTYGDDMRKYIDRNSEMPGYSYQQAAMSYCYSTTIKNLKYCYNKDTGKYEISTSTYLGSANGTKVDGWHKARPTELQWYTWSWYYYYNSKCQTGWQKIDGTWYYFYSDGEMAYNTTIGGYTLNASGAMVG